MHPSLSIILFSCFLFSAYTQNQCQFQNISTLYVSIEPTITYFHPTQHLPYAIVAIMVELLFVIPFVTLLVLYPFLLRFKRLNLTRLKPILDEYQSCYKDKFRSFSGFYLIALQMIFMVSLFNLGSFKSIFFLQIFAVVMLTVHSLAQPYRDQWVNVQDSLLLFDLILLSILHGNTANIVFDDIRWLKTILSYVLILSPILYMILLCFAPGVKWLLNTIKKRRTAIHEIQQEISSAQHSNTTNLDREPLLFYDSINSEHQPIVTANGRPLPSYSVVSLSASSNWSPATEKSSEQLPSINEDNNNTDL